jgi:hypothetical protein
MLNNISSKLKTLSFLKPAALDFLQHVAASDSIASVVS